MSKKLEKQENVVENNYVEGRNAVIELLRAEKSIDKIYIAPDLISKLKDITTLARQQNVVIVECDRRKLDTMSITKTHQGVMAQPSARDYVTIKDILDVADQRGEKPFIIVCDGITDPHNLGAIIRSAESAGAHGVIISKRRAVGLTAVVAKSSAGALEHIGVARVSNIAQTLEMLKENGVWIFGADADGDKNLYDADFVGSSAIVIGSEGDGISKIVRKTCDFIVSIPMCGKINSLNASVACGVLLYEAVRQRQK
ncbi:MAG: 23S rRNA (guanosine(2251)-2'-O)-methyltransferase RlmB [Clostridia bacterium]